MELAVGDSTALEIIFNSGHYVSKTTKTPSITTNEGPDIKNVRITMDVITNPDSTYPIIISPYKFDISQFGEKERSTLDFTINNVSDQDLDVKLIDLPTDIVKVTLPKRIKAKQIEKGKISVMKPFLTKEFEKSLTIELSDKEATRFTVPIKRTVRIPGVTQGAVVTPAGK